MWRATEQAAEPGLLPNFYETQYTLDQSENHDFVLQSERFGTYIVDNFSC